MIRSFVAAALRAREMARLVLAAPLVMMSSYAWAACGISSSGVEFGAYDPFSKQPLDSVGAIVVTCDEGEAYAVAISAGGGTYAARQMTAGGRSLAYNLYTDPAHAFVWGDGTGATATAGGVGTGAATHIAVYGRMPARQDVSVGRYVDSIIVTISF